MRIIVGSDHGGFRLKHRVVEHLRDAGHDVHDAGTHDGASCDYPDLAHRVTAQVIEGDDTLGILVCGTGQGVAIAANKRPGIRAAVVSDPFSARMAREHNDANVLCVGERVTGPGLALACIDAWLDARFAGGRHARRVAKIEPPPAG